RSCDAVSQRPLDGALRRQEGAERGRRLWQVGQCAAAPLAAHVHATAAAMQDGQIDRRYARVFETVATAWAESRKIRIAYSRQDPDGTVKVTRRKLSPLYLEPNPWGRGCYLIADDELTGQRRTF